MLDETILSVYKDIAEGKYSHTFFSDSEVVMITKELWAIYEDACDLKERLMQEYSKGAYDNVLEILGDEEAEG